MYQKPIISSESERHPNLPCGPSGCICESNMSSNEKHCHFIGAYYCWCPKSVEEGHSH